MAIASISALTTFSMSSPSPIVLTRSDWLSRVTECTLQEPLIETKPSLRGIRDAVMPPRAVFLGLGLCSPKSVSRAVPLDLLGVLLPAESIRRACGADQLILLIADRHAIATGHPPAEVEARARILERRVRQLCDYCGVDDVSIVRASSFGDTDEYQSTLRQVREQAGPASEYVHRQAADVLFFQRRHKSVLKVGWALRRGGVGPRLDEVAFDRALRDIGARGVSFVYCKPGRALNDRTPRVAPYLVRRPEQRLLLDPGEDVEHKLALAEQQLSPEVMQAFYRHLRLLLYTFGRMAEPIRGPALATRTQALLDQLA